MQRVNANATVDRLGQGLLGPWRVEVWGQEPHDFVRTYDIEAQTDDKAAREGIQRFVDEMNQLQEAKQ